jgi:hypothetical protein
MPSLMNVYVCVCDYIFCGLYNPKVLSYDQYKYPKNKYAMQILINKCKMQNHIYKNIFL